MPQGPTTKWPPTEPKQRDGLDVRIAKSGEFVVVSLFGGFVWVLGDWGDGLGLIFAKECGARKIFAKIG